MADKDLTCKDCGATFVFTEGEQQFYAEKGFSNEPVRCKDCRGARKAQKNNNKPRFQSDMSGGRGRTGFARF